MKYCGSKSIFSLFLILFFVSDLVAQLINTEVFPYGQELVFSSDSTAVSALEEYKALLAFNAEQAKVNKRNKYKFKLDSLFSWLPTLEGPYIDDCQDNRRGFVYDDNEDKFITYYWFCSNESPNTMEPRVFSVFTYDTAERLIRVTFSPWDGSYDNWNVDSTNADREYLYDNDGRLIRANHGGSLISRSNYTVYEYDSLGLPKSFSNYFRYNETEDYFHNYERTYTHNSKGELETSLTWRNYNLPDRGWEPEDSTYYSYYDDGMLKEEQYHNWSPVVLEDWRKNLYTTYSYNPDQSIASIYMLDLHDHDAEVWTLKLLDEYSYNDFGGLETISKYEVTDENNPKEFFRSEYIYDYDIMIDDVLVPRHLFSDKIKHLLLEEKHLRTDNSYPLIWEHRVNTIKYVYTSLNTSTSVHKSLA